MNTTTTAALAVTALRDTLRELQRAIALGDELHAEAEKLTIERDGARGAIKSASDACAVARHETEEIRERFNVACTDRDAALEELSRTKGALADLAKRVKRAETTIEKVDQELREAKAAISIAGVLHAYRTDTKG